MPTPAGVPVAMMSPGSSVMPREIVSISVGMSKIMSRVRASCRNSGSPPAGVTQPRIRVSRASSSSAVTIHGPIGQKVSQFLPSIHGCLRTFTSRALTSLTMV